MKRLATITVTALVLLAAGAGTTGAQTGLAAPAAAQAHVVTISGFAFQPQSLTVQLGDTVTWKNADPPSHTATADGGKWNTGLLANGASSAPVLMDVAGSFPYHCAPHPNMTGTIVVLAAAPAGQAPAGQAPAGLPLTSTGESPPVAPVALAALALLAIALFRIRQRQGM